MEFSKKQLRGITLVVQALSKKYNFIEGWEFISDLHRYEFVLFINLIVNPTKFINYYELKEENINDRLLKNFEVGTLFSLVNFGLTFGTDEQKKIWEEKFNFFYEEKKIMENQIDNFYKMLPEDLQVKNKYGIPCDIGISAFISPK